MVEGGSVHKKGEVTNDPEAKRWNSFKVFAERNSGMSEVALIRAFLDENPFRTGFILKELIKEVFPNFDQNILVQELLNYRNGLSQEDKRVIVETILAYLPTLSGLTDATAGLLIHAQRDYYISAAEAVAKSVTSFSDIQNQHIEKAVRNCVPVFPNSEFEAEWTPHTFPGNLRWARGLVPYADKHKLVTFLSLVPVYQYLQEVKTLSHHPFNKGDDTRALCARFNSCVEQGQFDQAENIHKELLGIYRRAVEGRVQIVDVGEEGSMALLPDDTP